MTAVTTAGLLAGLFGSAFVPAARAADTATQAYAAVNADNTAASDTVDYFKSTVYPQFTITINPGDADDSGTYGVAVSGGTIRGCSIATGAADAVAGGVVATTTLCTVSIDFNDGDANAVWTITLNKLAAGAQATVTASDDDTTSVSISALQILQGIASTAAAAVADPTNSQASVFLDINASGTSTTADVAPGTVGGKPYFHPTAAYAQWSGIVKNGYGNAVPGNGTAYTLLAEVDNDDYTVGCSTTEGAGQTNSGDALQSFSMDQANAAYACEVFVDGTDSVGGAFTLTVKTLTGIVVMSVSGGFFGEITSLTATAVAPRLMTDGGADIDNAIAIVAKDAAGRTWGNRALTAMTIGGLGKVAGALVDSTLTVNDASVAAVNTAYGWYQADNALCPSGAEDKTATMQVTHVNASGATIKSNSMTFTCGADKDSALYVRSLAFETASPKPGEAIELYVYLEDYYGVLAGAGDLADGGDVTVDFTGGTNLMASDGYCSADAEETEEAWDDATGIIDDTECATDGEGRIVLDVKASTTIATRLVASDPDSSATASAYVSESAAGTLVKVAGKAQVKATFADQGGRTIKFEVENANTGVIRVYSRRASAAGVATYTIARRGTYYVTAYLASDDSTLTETVTVKKK